MVDFCIKLVTADEADGLPVLLRYCMLFDTQSRADQGPQSAHERLRDSPFSIRVSREQVGFKEYFIVVCHTKWELTSVTIFTAWWSR